MAWVIIWLVQAGLMWFVWNVLFVFTLGTNLTEQTLENVGIAEMLFVSFLLTVVYFLISVIRGRK